MAPNLQQHASSTVPHICRTTGVHKRRLWPALLAILFSGMGASEAARLGNRVICYATNWAQYRPGACSWKPNQLNATLCTHVNFAFGALTKDFAIKNGWNDASTLLPMTQALRRQNPQLKLLLSVGGWTHNDPGSGTENFFSQAVATAANRTKFANNAQRWLDRWKFDGLDIDWEYPGVANRGGNSTDRIGLSHFVRVFKAIAARRKKSYLLTMATAATRQSNVGMDWPGLIPYVDFFSLMAYDFHGGWEMATNYHTPWKDALGGTLDIQTTLRWYLDVAKVPKRKINLGIAGFGRTWTLANKLRSGLGARTTAVGPAGGCTGERGILGWAEIRMMIATGKAQVRVSNAAKAAYLVRGTTWVGFDLPQTIYLKLLAAAQLELGGVMFWAADLDDSEATILKLLKYKANPGSWTKYLPAGAMAASAASEGAISINPAGLYCGGGSVGNGVCQQRKLCCSQWGHCGTSYAYCSLDKAYCVGGPCQALASSRAAKAPRINNGTSWGDSLAGYQRYSAQRGVLYGP